MKAPLCPRCGTSTFVRRGVPGLQPRSWSCRSCRLGIELLALTVLVWRLGLWDEFDRIMREAGA